MTQLVSRIELSGEEVRRVRDLIESLRTQYGDPGATAFLERGAREAGRLPDRIVDFVLSFRYHERSALALISGFPITEAGPTPRHWRERANVVSGPGDYWIVLFGTLLGDPVSWASLQDGRILNDIHPIAGQEAEQTGHGSEVALDLHVEDAFHENRCHHLLLMCLRNKYGTASTATSVDSIDLTDTAFDPLFEPRFTIRPDTEHLRNMRTFPGFDEASYDSSAPVLYGSRSSPYVRLDPPFTTVKPGDSCAAQALDKLTVLLDQATEEIALVEGDVLMVDNQRALRGRRPFTPRYDGGDRWLRRVTTVRDLTSSRARRKNVRERVILPF